MADRGLKSPATSLQTKDSTHHHPTEKADDDAASHHLTSPASGSSGSASASSSPDKEAPDSWVTKVNDWGNDPLPFQLDSFGETVLWKGVSQQEFLDQVDAKGDDFAKRVEWRRQPPTADGQEAALGDLFATKMPGAPHERAQEALKTAVIDNIGESLPGAGNRALRGALVGTGSTRYTDAARSAESDGGFCPKNSPMNAGGKAVPPLVFEGAYSESLPHIQEKVAWWFGHHGEVRHVVVVWIRKHRYAAPGGHGGHGVAPGQRPVLVWHYERVLGAVAPAANFRNVALGAGAAACATCALGSRHHVDIGSSWVGAGYGVHTITIPSGDLFHTVGGVPAGFPANVVIDLYLVRDALEQLQDADFQW